MFRVTLHRDRLDRTEPVVERRVERLDHEQRCDHHGDDGAHEEALDNGTLAAVGEEEREDEDHRRDEEEHDPERRRDHALGSVDPVVARLLARRGLLEPLVVRGLFRVGLGFDRLERPEERDRPGVDRVACGTRLHERPFLTDDRPRVTDQLARELGRHVVGKKLRRLELLRNDDRLVLGARARDVVVREREEDDEAEQDGKAGGEHAEDACGAVAVVEVSTVRGATPQEQERGDRDGRRADHDHGCQKDVHPTERTITCPRAGRYERRGASPG